MFQVPPVACVWCAQAYAQRKTNHPRSTVHPWRQVAVLWQLLTLTATCKWMAHMTADAGTLTADVTKLLDTRTLRTSRKPPSCDFHFWRALLR